MTAISRFFASRRATHRVITIQTRRGQWRWRVVDADGKAVALAVIKDNHSCREDAQAAGREFIRRMGAPSSVMGE